jgi:molybdopterin-guanine dinucleotide biosynthesis protein B
MPPVLAFTGKPNCGKTTLIEKLIPALTHKGIRTGTIKHHRGAIQMDTSADTPVEDLIGLFFPDIDLVIAEGYKMSSLPKIEVYRSTLYDEPLQDPGETLIAMVSDRRIRYDLPWFKPEDIDGLAAFILEKILTR